MCTEHLYSLSETLYSEENLTEFSGSYFWNGLGDYPVNKEAVSPNSDLTLGLENGLKVNVKQLLNKYLDYDKRYVSARRLADAIQGLSSVHLRAWLLVHVQSKTYHPDCNGGALDYGETTSNSFLSLGSATFYFTFIDSSLYR